MAEKSLHKKAIKGNSNMRCPYSSLLLPADCQLQSGTKLYQYHIAIFCANGTFKAFLDKQKHSPVQRVNRILDIFKEFEAYIGRFQQATSLVDHGHRYNIS